MRIFIKEYRKIKQENKDNHVRKKQHIGLDFFSLTTLLLIAFINLFWLLHKTPYICMYHAYRY